MNFVVLRGAAPEIVELNRCLPFKTDGYRPRLQWHVFESRFVCTSDRFPFFGFFSQHIFASEDLTERLEGGYKFEAEANIVFFRKTMSHSSEGLLSLIYGFGKYIL